MPVREKRRERTQGVQTRMVSICVCGTQTTLEERNERGAAKEELLWERSPRHRDGAHENGSATSSRSILALHINTQKQKRERDCARAAQELCMSSEGAWEVGREVGGMGRREANALPERCPYQVGALRHIQEDPQLVAQLADAVLRNLLLGGRPGRLVTFIVAAVVQV